MSSADLTATPTLHEIMCAGARVMLGDWTPSTKESLRRCAKAFRRQSAKHARASLSGAPKGLRGREFHLEHSLAARICTLLLAYPKLGKPMTWEEAVSEAKQVSLRKWSGEPVKAYNKAKPEGGVRPISVFGPRWRAANYLVDILLAVRLPPAKHAFLQKGRGRDAAINDMLNQYRNGGARKFLQADVANCFSSLDIEALSKACGLPRAMWKCLAVPPEASLQIHSTTLTPGPTEIAVRAGLPHGLRSSTRIVNWTLEARLAPLDVPLNFYVDDIIIALKKDADVESVKSAVVSALAGHPAGPLSLKHLTLYGLEGGFDYLGYEIVPRLAKFGGFARARPSNKAHRRFHSRLAVRLALLPVADQYSRAWDLSEQWASSFGAWTGRKPGGVIAYFESDAARKIARDFQYWLLDQPKMTPHAAMSVFKKLWLPQIAATAKAD